MTHAGYDASRSAMLNRYLNYLGLTGYLFLGTAAILIPAVMPFVTAEFLATGLTLAAIGMIFPSQAIGGILGNLLAGIGSDLMGRQRLVGLSALLLASSLALVAIAKLWLLFVIGFIMVGTAQGALSTGINVMVADVNRGSQARALNTLHGVYGVGAAMSPLIIGYFIDHGMPWRWALGGVGFIWLAYGLIMALFRQTETPDKQPGKVQKLDFGMLRARPFLMLFLIAFIYNGVAVSLLGWIAVFMQRTTSFSTFFSLSMISVFYVALTTGRFLCAIFVERLGYAMTMRLLALGLTVTYPLLVLGGNSMLVIAGVFFTGLSFSGLFPTALAYGARLYPKQAGTLSGTLGVGMALGSMVPPLWTGVIADVWNFQIALGINYVMVLALIVIVIYLGRIEGRNSEV